MRDDDRGRRIASDFIEEAGAHALRHLRRRVHEQEIIVAKACRVAAAEMQHRVVGGKEILQHLDAAVAGREAL